MKRIVSALLAVLLLFSIFSVSAFADSSYSLFCPRCNTFQLQGAVTEHAYCPKCGGLLLKFGGGDSRGSGAGRRPGAASIEVPKQYYTTPSADGSGTAYNGGTTSYYSVMNTQNNTLNFTTWNKVTNNYTQNNYTYNNYTYNNEYNYYTYNIENHNYYVTNNYTYVTVVYPDGTQDENGNDNYESVDIYYKLPDGRNSYDLTADEIYGTYLTYNVTGAEKVLEDDGITLGLWHLDGDLKDSSALSGQYLLTSGLTNFVDVELGDWGQAVSGTSGKVSVSNFSGNEAPWTFEFRVYFAGSGNFKLKLPVYSCSYSISGSSTDFDSAKPSSPTYSTMSVPSNQWNSIAFTYDGTAFKAYLNGSLYTSISEFGRYDAKTTAEYTGNYGGKSYVMSGLTPQFPSTHPEDSSYRFDYIVGRNWKERFFDTTLFIETTSSGKFTVDEVRLSKTVLYSDDYLTSSQPFDTNSVLLRPENPAENDIVIMSNIPVADYRIGGVRPTYPSLGSTFIYLENDVVQSIQQYQGDGWVSVDAFIWQDGEWKNLLKYNFADLKFEEPDEPAPSPSPSPDPGGCTHEYVVDSEKAPTCTVKGSTTYKCKLCGDSYTEDIPALGHDWQIVGTGGGTIVSPSPSPDSSSSVASSGSESTSEPTSSEPPAPTQPPATEPEYTLYRCSRCGMEYKDYEGSGPPSGGDEDEEEGGILGMLKKLLGSIVNGIVSILETVLGGVIKLLVSLIDELVSGLTAVIDGLISSMGQIANFGGTFKDFLGQVFPFIPSEIVMLLGFSLSLSIILMIIKFFRG